MLLTHYQVTRACIATGIAPGGGTNRVLQTVRNSHRREYLTEAEKSLPQIFIKMQSVRLQW